MQSSKPTIRIVAIPPCSLLLAGLVSSPSWAHPGHGAGGGDWSMLHYLTEQDHLLTALALALLFAGPLVWRAIRVRKSSRTH